MEEKFFDYVYATLTDQLEDHACLPEVENLFEDGMLCEKCYSDMLDAYERLCERLGVQDEDADVEIIINALLSICKEVGYRMYHYGTMFGQEEG